MHIIVRSDKAENVVFCEDHFKMSLLYGILVMNAGCRLGLNIFKLLGKSQAPLAVKLVHAPCPVFTEADLTCSELFSYHCYHRYSQRRRKQKVPTIYVIYM